jgi:hypothetical protein
LLRLFFGNFPVAHSVASNVYNTVVLAVQIGQSMHFDGGFVLSKLRPGKQRQAQIDGGGIQWLPAVVEIHADGIGGLKGPGAADQVLGEIWEDAPIVRFVDVRQDRSAIRLRNPMW